MIVLLGVAGILVTALTVLAMVLLVPGGTVTGAERGSFGQEAPDHGTATTQPREPDR